MLEISIRPANFNDESEVVDLFYSLMLHHSKLSLEREFVCTPRNAQLFWDHIFKNAIACGDPVLLAFAKDVDQPVGAIFWCEIKSPILLRERTAMGWGTYVKPGFRRQRIGSMLRKEALRVCDARGIKIVRGVVAHGNDSHFASEHSDRFEIVGIQYKISTESTT